MMKTQILIQYDNSDDAMYGGDTTDVDYAASEAKFEKQLRAALKKAFPGSKITIETGYGRYSVDGSTDTDDAVLVGEYVNRVWSTFDWLVTR